MVHISPRRSPPTDHHGHGDGSDGGSCVRCGACVRHLLRSGAAKSREVGVVGSGDSGERFELT